MPAISVKDIARLYHPEGLNGSLFSWVKKFAKQETSLTALAPAKGSLRSAVGRLMSRIIQGSIY